MTRNDSPDRTPEHPEADQSSRDSVTGLLERAHFNDQLRRDLEMSGRGQREFAVVSLALDPLSESAKALGPEARTRVHEALGGLLRSTTQGLDSGFRIKDDLFALLLSGVGRAAAHARMEGLRRQCATQVVTHNGSDIGFTVSMGVASYPQTAHGQQDLVDAANAALSEAQRRGGNHVSLAPIRFETA